MTSINIWILGALKIRNLLCVVYLIQRSFLYCVFCCYTTFLIPQATSRYFAFAVLLLLIYEATSWWKNTGTVTPQTGCRGLWPGPWEALADTFRSHSLPFHTGSGVSFPLANSLSLHEINWQLCCGSSHDKAN